MTNGNSREGTASQHRPRRFRSRRFVTALVASLGLMLVAGGGLASASRSAVTATATPSTGASFCQEAVIFNKSSIGSNLMTLSPAAIKSDYAKLKAAEPAVVGSAPSSIKADLQKIFTFDNGIFQDLSKVGWSVFKLTKSDLESLGVNGPKLKPAGDAVTAYLDKTCGLKLPMP